MSEVWLSSSLIMRQVLSTRAGMLTALTAKPMPKVSAAGLLRNEAMRDSSWSWRRSVPSSWRGLQVATPEDRISDWTVSFFIYQV